MRLIHRLFLAFATLSLAAIISFAVIQRDSFRRGFLDYLEGVSLQLLEQCREPLIAQYREHSNWDFLRGSPRRLIDILGVNRAARELAGVNASDPQGAGRGPPPPRFERERPPLEEAAKARRDSNQEANGPHRRPPPPTSRRAAEDPLDIGGRLSLFDAQGQIVVGPPRPPADSLELAIVDGENVLGRLVLARLPTWRGALDEAFAAALWQRALLGGAVVLAFSLFLAWLLARWLQRPISELADAAQRMAAGDYSTPLKQRGSDELAALAQQFNRLAVTLETHRASRRQWGADIAHELRTPLAILRGEIQALQDGVRQFSPDTLASLEAETDRLTQLVEDLYQLALSDAGALEYRFDTVDLATLLRDAVDLHQANLADAGLQLILTTIPSGSLLINGDARRLAQLFDNLIANARSYTDAPGRVEIAASAADQGWVVTIDDTPPGVPADALPKLFERMYRAETSRNRATGGAGLGLSIARNIVEAHNGFIAASSSPLGGVRMTIRLPQSTGANS